MPRLARRFGDGKGSVAPGGGKCNARVRGLAIGQVAGPLRFCGLRARPLGNARVDGHRALALDQTARDIVGDSRDDRVERLAFGHQHAAVARVLEKSIGALVVRHVDECDHVDEEARMLALGQRQIKQINTLRRLVDDRLQRALERFETDNFELAHLRNRFGALGVLDPSLPDRGAEVRLDRDVMGLVVHRLAFRPRSRQVRVAGIRRIASWPGSLGELAAIDHASGDCR